MERPVKVACLQVELVVFPETFVRK